MTEQRDHHTPWESESPEARRDRQRLAVAKVLDAALAGSAELPERLARAGLAPEDVKSPEAWERIPPLTKKELIAFQQGRGLAAMLSLAVGELSRVYMSPGPIFDPEGRDPDYWGWTEAFHAAGFRPGDLAQMTFSYHLTPAGHMLEEPLRTLGCAVIPAGPGNTEVQIDLLTKLPVTAGRDVVDKVIGMMDKALQT